MRGHRPRISLPLHPGYMLASRRLPGNDGPDRSASMDSTLMKFPLPALIALLISVAPAAALEQNCRFIQAKVDREACYKRQEDELAAKRKPAPATDESKTLETLRQLRQEDDAVYRSINNICRGC
ncbi:hypothetical protein SAMN05216338_103287 [Bradyrhizobium sp. Rc2d]|nr:hypothetical protein SAMN05216338_103287 [Bradyrhizobium sp. Rc2d]